MLIGYIENGIALNKNWEPFTRRAKDGTVSPVRIFDAEKKLILGHGEKILLERADTYFEISDDWRNRQLGGNPNHFDGYQKPGTTILTNKRIIFYRVPDPYWAAAGMHPIRGIGASLLATDLKNRGMLEFCQVNFNNIVKMNYLQGWGARLFLFVNYKRYGAEVRLLKKPEDFSLLKTVLRSREINKSNKKESEFYYVDPPFFDDIKKHWKRDDLLKKASRYEHWGKYKKALAQYQKILEIFPDDESTRKKVKRLSGAGKSMDGVET